MANDYADLLVGSEIPDGIYLRLPKALYFGDQGRLGSTDLNVLARDPVEFRWAQLHGEEREENASQARGSAVHTFALEGREEFDRQFCVAPDKADNPNALITMDHLRAHCAALGIRGGRTKAEVTATIRQHDQSVVIWDELMEKFAADNPGKAVISRKLYTEVETASQWMQQNDKLSPIMKDGTLVAGESEVSIFYTDNGVRLRCRLDHLLPHAIVDLKTFRSIHGEKVSSSIRRAIADWRYDLQAASYIRGWKHAQQLFKDGKVFGANDEQHALLAAAFASPEKKWIWIFVKNHGAPQPIVAEFDLRSFIFKTAQDMVDRAIDDYRTLREKFGDDADWTPQHECEVLGDTDFPSYAFM